MENTPEHELKRYFRPLKIGKILQEQGTMTIITFLCRFFSFWSEERWTRMLLEGHCLVNGHIVSPNYMLARNDNLTYLQFPEDEPYVNKDYQILYEDEHLIALNKPSPLPVHPCGKYYHNSLTEILLSKNIIAHPVHRLDRETSGLLICAKTDEVKESLRKQFSEKNITKEYVAIIKGNVKICDLWSDEYPCVSIDQPIAELYPRQTRARMGVDPSGKSALTLVRLIEKCEYGCKLQVTPLTGRTNQIRVHLAWLGLPIIGDTAYGGWDDKNPNTPRLALHAHRMQFYHPVLKQNLRLEAPLPLEFSHLWKQLKEGRL